MSTSLSSAESVAVTLPAAGGTGKVITVDIDRDLTKVSGYTGTYSVGQPIGLSPNVMDATFYSLPGEQGAVVGAAQATMSANGSSLSLTNIVVSGTVSQVVVLPATLLETDSPKQLLFEALDRNGNAIAVSPGSANWTVVLGGSVAVTPDGIATPKAIGTTNVQVSVDGIKSPSATVNVSSTALSGVYYSSYGYSSLGGTITFTVMDDNSVTSVAEFQNFTYTGKGNLTPTGADQANVSIVLSANGLTYGTVSGTFTFSNNARLFTGNLAVSSGSTAPILAICDGNPPSMSVVGGLVPTASVDNPGDPTITYNGKNYPVVGANVQGYKAVLLDYGQSFLQPANPNASAAYLSVEMTDLDDPQTRCNLPFDSLSTGNHLLPCAIVQGNYQLMCDLLITDGNRESIYHLNIKFSVTPNGVLTYPTKIQGTLPYSHETFPGCSLQISDSLATIGVGLNVSGTNYGVTIPMINGVGTYQPSGIPGNLIQGELSSATELQMTF